MPKRLRIPTDENELAASIVARSTEPDLKAIAKELGRRGGKKGGKARAEKLSGEQLAESASNAAKVRWERYRAEKAAKAGS